MAKPCKERISLGVLFWHHSICYELSQLFSLFKSNNLNIRDTKWGWGSARFGESYLNVRIYSSATRRCIQKTKKQNKQTRLSHFTPCILYRRGVLCYGAASVLTPGLNCWLISGLRLTPWVLLQIPKTAFWWIHC